MFFGKFDKIQYNGKTVVDITNSILLKYRPMNNTTLYTYHTVVDGETPASLAHSYYGKSVDHWIILLLNNIVDPFFGWALTARELPAMVTSKYGEGNENKVHHLVNTSTHKIVGDYEQGKYISKYGDVIKPLPYFYRPVSNMEYETTENDKKRDIKILAPKYVQDFKNQFEDLMNGDYI